MTTGSPASSMADGMQEQCDESVIERIHQLKKAIREEANATKACVTDVAFKTFAICATALSVIVANIEKCPTVGLASAPILILCLFVNRITAYKYATANRNFAYDMHLDRTLFVYAGDAYERHLLRIGWEDAMFAWRIVQAKVFHYLYPRVRLYPFLNVGYYQRKLEGRLAEYPWFDSLLLADVGFAPPPSSRPPQQTDAARLGSARHVTETTPSVVPAATTLTVELDAQSLRDSRAVNSALRLTVFGYAAAFAALAMCRSITLAIPEGTPLWLCKSTPTVFMNVGLCLFLFRLELLQRPKQSISFHPGTYLRHIHTALDTLCCVCIIILNWCFWKVARLDSQHDTETAALFVVAGVCTLLFISRANSIARRRRILECGLLSIQTSAILWRAVMIAYVRALELIKWEDNRLRNLTRVMAEMGDMLVQFIHDRTIHDWVDPQNHESIMSEARSRLDSGEDRRTSACITFLHSTR